MIHEAEGRAGSIWELGYGGDGSVELASTVWHGKSLNR